MSTDNIDIVVSQTGARTVKRDLDDLGTSAAKAGVSVEAMQAELNASKNAIKLLETEVANLTKQVREMQDASDKGSGSHKKHTNEIVSLKREMAGTQRTVNFFARALNDIIPASSGAGEGMRVLAAGMVGGAGVGLAIEATLAGLKLLGDALKSNEEKALHQVEIAGKQREAMIALDESVEKYLGSLQIQGKGTAWFTQQLEDLSSQIRKTSNEAVTELSKLQILRDGWFNGGKIKEGEQKFRDLLNQELDLKRQQYWVAKDYAFTVLPKTIEAEEKALQKSVTDIVSSVDGEAMKSKALTWVGQQQEQIQQRMDSLTTRAAELRAQLDPKQGTLVNGAWRPTEEQNVLQETIKGFDLELSNLEQRAARLSTLAKPIAEAQGRQTATEWERQEAESTRRVRREEAQLGADEYEQINSRAASAVEELTAKTNRTLETMIGASEVDKNRVRSASAMESLEIEKKRMAEQTELMKKGGVLKDLRAELDPVAAATQKAALAEQLMDRAQTQGLVSTAEKAKLTEMLNLKYRDALDPIGALTRELDRETLQLGLNNDEREVSQKLFSAEKTLRQQGITLTSEETDALRKGYQALQESNKAAQVRESLYKGIRGPQEELVHGQTALNQLLTKGKITLDEYNRSMANLRLQANKGNWTDGYLKSLGVLDKANQNFAQRSGQAFGEMTNTLVDGLATATARAIVFGENFEESVGNVAREALASLIAALIKMGIQMMLNYILGETLGQSATSATAGMAAESATAWAPAAALASLASYGANAGPAMVGVSTTMALTEGLALAGSAAGFEQGGFTGYLGTSQVAGVVHGQEFVATAAATRRNRQTLEAMNNGATVTPQTAKGGMNITIENHTTASFEARQVGPNEYRIIAREEAHRAVQEQASTVVASDLSNPNSRVSRALGRNTYTQRKRT